MTVRLHGISISYDQNPEEELPRAVAQRLGVEASRPLGLSVVRRSIDARHRPIKLVFTVDITFKNEADINIPGEIAQPQPAQLKVQSGKTPLASPPLVVGGGPAGLFAALLLAEHGYCPLLVDRGGNIRARTEALGKFQKTRKPDPECNTLFGLGGAGTFSDGKLTTGINHPWLSAVLDILVDCGAPKSIRFDAQPHVGTDVLSKVVENLARRIELAGGTVSTSVRVDNILHDKGMLKGVETTKGPIQTTVTILAIGHSARDTWSMLEAAGLNLEPKPFQMGIRVEHPQEWLDELCYGKAAGHPALGAATYKLATRVNGAPVFSFCMCPGGETIPTVNEPGHLAINGMSLSARDSAFASSGLVVTLYPKTIGSADKESSLDFQRKVEKACFKAGGSEYRAPAQRLKEFAAGRASGQPLPQSSYRLGITPARLDEILPEQIAKPIRGSLVHFNRSLNGYIHPEAIALAPESRASSPVRIVRDSNTLETPGIGGIYPAGEGAGYAGGIMSSALDGLNAARKIIERYARTPR